jgi:hypothetical protein
MNVATAPIAFNNGAQFYPDPTGDVGNLYKVVDDQTLVVFDYTSLLASGVTVQNVASFTLDIQTNPQLIISNTNIPDANKKKLSFVVSAGVGGVLYDLTANVTMSDASIHTHVLHVNVVSPTIDSCCAPGSVPIAISAGGQQALLVEGGVYGNTMPRYYVSQTAPPAPLVFDRWYNSATGVISDYVTDGVSGWWQSLYSLDVNLTKVTLYYFATASQITFNTTTLDIFNNQIPLKDTYALDVLINGVRSLPQTPDGVSGDYVTNISASTVTFKQALIPNDVVIFDIVEIT